MHTACGCENVLHKCRGSGRCLNIKALDTLFENSSDQLMIGSDLFDAIPCNVKVENISNCNKSRIYFRRWQQAWNTETTVKFGTLHRRIVLLSSSTLASVKSYLQVCVQLNCQCHSSKKLHQDII